MPHDVLARFHGHDATPIDADTVAMPMIATPIDIEDMVLTDRPGDPLVAVELRGLPLMFAFPETAALIERVAGRDVLPDALIGRQGDDFVIVAVLADTGSGLYEDGRGGAWREP